MEWKIASEAEYMRRRISAYFLLWCRRYFIEEVGNET